MTSATVADIRDAVGRLGWILLADMPIDAVLQIAGHLGRIVADPRTGAAVRELRPQRLDRANPNTLSSRYGDGSFPFHTEAAYLPIPPRVVILYCQHPGSGRRPTHLLDSSWLIERLTLTDRPGSWVVRAGRPAFLAHVAERVGTRIVLRYDAECMFPSGRTSYLEQRQIDEFLKSAAATRIQWRPGDLPVIDNARVLHGRGSSVADDRDRVLKRAMIAEECRDGMGL